MYLSHHTCPQTGKKALGSAVEQAPHLSPVRQMHRVGIHHVLSSKTWEPEGAAGFHGIDLEHVHEYFNLVQDLLLAVLCLTLKSAQTGLSSDETKLEDALSRNLSNPLQQLIGTWSAGQGYSWAGEAD